MSGSEAGSPIENKESSNLSPKETDAASISTLEQPDTTKDNDTICSTIEEDGTVTTSVPASATTDSQNASTADTTAASVQPASGTSSNTSTTATKPLPPGVTRKKEIMRPLFSRSSTTDKVNSKPGATKSMIVETETFDATTAPSVALPIASSSNVITNELMSNNPSLATNMSTLRSKKSTLFPDGASQQAAQASSSTNFDNDNASITGSIRNPVKRLNPAESHLNISKQGATKADLFAAKIANAVGDASDSDSEETFVYESAPDAMASNTLPLKPAALGATNPLALRKMSQRNISMPVTSPAHPYVPVAPSSILVPAEDKEQPNFETDEESNHSSNQDQRTLTKSGVEAAQQSTDTGKTMFTKYNGSRKPSTTSLLAAQRNNNVSQLRTTTSKLFDVKGGTLRRYSGVPDDVNIEDYLDQYDEEHEANGSDYADSFHYEDEDEDDELTPLNVNNANHNLRKKMSKHYQNKRSVSNFGSLDRYDYAELGLNTNNDTRRPRSLKGKKQRVRSYHQYPQEQQHYSPHNFYNRKRTSKIQLLKNAMWLSITVFVLIAVGFVGGFLLATTKELQDVQIVSIDDILVSMDELIFDVTVRAYNHGLMTVEVSDVELDIFAKSSYLKEPAPMFPVLSVSESEVETVLLGSVSKFEVPLEFTSGFFHKNFTTSKGEIKLLHPGQNSTDANDGQENHKTENDSEKWRKIINHPFDLIIRGRFMYEVPLFRTEQSVAVTKTVAVDPTKDDDNEEKEKK